MKYWVLAIGLLLSSSRAEGPPSSGAILAMAGDGCVAGAHYFHFLFIVCFPLFYLLGCALRPDPTARLSLFQLPATEESARP